MKTENIANQAQYAGSGAAVFFGLTANEVAALGGLLIAFLGLVINVYYKHQHYKLAREQSANKPQGVLAE